MRIIQSLPEESFSVIVAIDVNLGEGVMGCGLLASFVYTHLQPWQEQLQSKSEQHVIKTPLDYSYTET